MSDSLTWYLKIYIVYKTNIIMKHVSTYQTIELTPDELIKLIPDKVLESIERTILDNANKEYGWTLSKIDFVDTDDDKLSFGLCD